MTKSKILVVLGPTASGKTNLSIKLSKDFHGEIISADAFQVYRELNVGVNKPSAKDLKKTNFHLISDISIFDDWDVTKFQKIANKKIQLLIDQKILPIVAGGSNLYIDALIYNYDFSNALKRSDSKFEHLTNKELFEHIKNINSDQALKIGPNNRKRLLRAYEKILNNVNDFNKKQPTMYDCFIILMDQDRSKIYQQINDRTNEMIINGWVNEVESLLKKYGYDKLSHLNAFKAIGYEIIAKNLMNHESINQTLIAQKTRNYAKRQITWIKHHYPNCFLYNNNYQLLVKEIKAWLDNKN